MRASAELMRAANSAMRSPSLRSSSSSSSPAARFGAFSGPEGRVGVGGHGAGARRFPHHRGSRKGPLASVVKKVRRCDHHSSNVRLYNDLRTNITPLNRPLRMPCSGRNGVGRPSEEEAACECRQRAASASDGPGKMGSRTPPDRGTRIRQWQNGTPACEFGTRRGRAADPQRTTRQRARPPARQWQNGIRTCELGTAPRTASPSAIEVGFGAARWSGSPWPEQVGSAACAANSLAARRSGRPGFRGSARRCMAMNALFGVALRECASGSRSVAVGPCAKQPDPDRFPETVIAGEPRQVRSGQPHLAPSAPLHHTSCGGLQ